MKVLYFSHQPWGYLAFDISYLTQSSKKKKITLYKLLLIKKKDFIYLFLDRGEAGEIWSETLIGYARPQRETQPATQACVLTGN